MKICAYVQERYAKQAYKNECMETRQFVGLRVVIDAIERAGYGVEWAGKATVHEYDIVLVSLTSDCDWWGWIAERLQWRKGDYKVIVGGAGVLHVVPFLQFADFFVLGRGEETAPALVRALDGKGECAADNVIEAARFSYGKTYMIAQAHPYPHGVAMFNGKRFEESTIGCNHKCYFCGYTWQRKFVSPFDYYGMDDALFGDIRDKEKAILDMKKSDIVDFSKLRTTAIDGMSERLRFMVNKKITKNMFIEFICDMIKSKAKPHQIKIYNICGYPTETMEDWQEYIDTIEEADNICREETTQKQWCLLLHSTPFRAMPATPMACCEMSKKNYRGQISKTLGKNYRGYIIGQYRHVWSVETGATESLSAVMLSALAHRGAEKDAENITKLCRSKKFWSASTGVKEATLCKYFDMDHLFGQFDAETLPSRYLRTYAAVEKFWRKPFWEKRAQ